MAQRRLLSTMVNLSIVDFGGESNVYGDAIHFNILLGCSIIRGGQPWNSTNPVGGNFVVTGGTSGIGLVTARMAGGHGCLGDYSGLRHGPGWGHPLGDWHREAIYLRADLSDEVQLRLATRESGPIPNDREQP